MTTLGEMYRKQLGSCFLCEGALPERPRRYRDKATGRVKVLLCYTCSGGMKAFSTPKALQKAISLIDADLPLVPRIRKDRTRRTSDTEQSVLDEIAILALSLNARGRLLAAKLGISEAAALSRVRRAVKGKVLESEMSQKRVEIDTISPFSTTLGEAIEEVTITLDNEGNVCYTP